MARYGFRAVTDGVGACKLTVTNDVGTVVYEGYIEGTEHAEERARQLATAHAAQKVTEGSIEV